MAIFTPLTLASLAMRLYVIFKVNRRNLQSDDILVVFSVASPLAFEGATFWAIYNSLGASSNVLQWPQITIQIKGAPVGADYPRGRWHPHFHRFLHDSLQSLLGHLGQGLSKTNCQSRTQFDLAAVIYNIFLDLAVVFVLLPILWRLQTLTFKKIGVSIMFSLGFITISMMTWRVVTTVRPHKSTDQLYGAVLRTLQALLELWLGIIAVNLPAGAPLFARISTFNISKNRKLASVRRNATPNIVSLQTIGNVPSRKPADRKGFQVLTDIETLDNTVKGVNKAQMISKSLQHQEDESESLPTPTGLV
ncbi:hypothetical protein F4678DRAFT_485293 [Xylaria arbuscula]|nr:hypothetical protein F4678DRAFT_485293 [Xylaria arbuscula]